LAQILVIHLVGLFFNLMTCIKMIDQPQFLAIEPIMYNCIHNAYAYMFNVSPILESISIS